MRDVAGDPQDDPGAIPTTIGPGHQMVSFGPMPDGRVALTMSTEHGGVAVQASLVMARENLRELADASHAYLRNTSSGLILPVG